MIKNGSRISNGHSVIGDEDTETSVVHNITEASKLTSGMNMIGPQVKSARQALDLTLKDLEFKCNSIGWDISYTSLSKIEQRKRKVTDIELNILCQVLKVKSTVLLEG